MNIEPNRPPGTSESGISDCCPLCGSAELIARHCKLLCPNCGYVESCEDIFPTRCYRAIEPQPPRLDESDVFS